MPIPETNSAEVETVKNVYAAINRFDIEGVLEHFDPRIERTEPEGFPAAGTFRGFTEVGAHLTQGRSTWAEGTCTPERFLETGDKIVAFVRIHVRLKDRIDWIHGQVFDVFAFQNGKITQFRTFAEERQALEWAGAGTN